MAQRTLNLIADTNTGRLIASPAATVSGAALALAPDGALEGFTITAGGGKELSPPPPPPQEAHAA
jgi:hypothetical protein